MGCSGNKNITFSLIEDKVGPGVVNTPQGLFIEATIYFVIKQGCQISPYMLQ